MISLVKKRDVWRAAEQFGMACANQDDAVALRTASFINALGFGRVALIGGKVPDFDFGPDFAIDHITQSQVSEYAPDITPLLANELYDLVVVRSFQALAKNSAETVLNSLASFIVPSGNIVLNMDLYLTDHPSEFWVNLYERLLASLADSDHFWADTTQVPELKFTCSAATLPDQAMNDWRRFSPSLHELRIESQLVTMEAIAKRASQF